MKIKESKMAKAWNGKKFSHKGKTISVDKNLKWDIKNHTWIWLRNISDLDPNYYADSPPNLGSSNKKTSVFPKEKKIQQLKKQSQIIN
jgi:hypothetical protein